MENKEKETKLEVENWILEGEMEIWRRTEETKQGWEKLYEEVGDAGLTTREKARSTR
jgi:hypothetical protein